jgi:hypothetical protein
MLAIEGFHDQRRGDISPCGYGAKWFATRIHNSNLKINFKLSIMNFEFKPYPCVNAALQPPISCDVIN